VNDFRFPRNLSISIYLGPPSWLFSIRPIVSYYEADNGFVGWLVEA